MLEPLEEEHVDAAAPFNSLFEMPSRFPAAARRLGRASTFNSLFEMLKLIHRLNYDWYAYSAFNSLFEMRVLKWLSTTPFICSFNSLFEMLETALKASIIKYDDFQFSI